MISPETIALVKERTDLVALIGESVRLTRRGRSFTGLCPFHKEKTPSFHVNPERGFYHCFGCKESGGAIDFLMKVEGRTFVEAVRALAERAGVEVAETMTDAERREAHAARRSKDDLYAVMNLAATFFEHSLRGGPGMSAHPLSRYARDELARRGLPLPAEGDVGPIADALQAFRIGYAPFGWDGLTSFLRQQGVSPVLGERVGLLAPRSSGSGHYDRFRHRLMFAVTDVMGRVIAFSGRALADPSPAELSSLGITGPAPQADGAAPAKYINSPESPIYTKGEHLFGLHQARHTVRQRGEAILVEGNFDVVALHARGITSAVAPLGTAFTVAQAKLIKRFAPSVVLLFDGDAAGKKATRAARAPCLEAGLSAKAVSLPRGLDPDEIVRQKGPSALTQLIQGARALLQYLIDEELDVDRFKAATLAEQQAKVRAVQELLRTEPDPNLRGMASTYADHLSAKLLIHGQPIGDLTHLTRALSSALSQIPVPPLRVSETVERYDRARSRALVAEIRLAILGAVLDFPELLGDPDVEEALTVLDGDVALAVVAARHRPIPEKGLAAAEFLAQIPPSIHSFAAGRLVSPAFEAAHEAKTELLENARKLRRLTLLRENAAVVDQLQKGVAMGDVAAEDALLREVQRRALEKHRLS